MPDDRERPIPVGIGLISRDGRYLIRLRPEGSPMAGCWEFPGGKCEADESPGDATARECLEEVGVEVTIGALFRRVVHRYPHGLVALHYYRCTTDGDPAEDSGFRWVPASSLVGYRFPEANDAIIAALAREGDRSTGPRRDEP